MMNESGLREIAALKTRLLLARALGEHHIWHAIKIMEESADQPQFRRVSRLCDLLEARALLDAVIELGIHLQPARTPWLMGRSGGRWQCRIGWHDRGRLSRCFGRHDDLPAAMMIALLDSFGRGGQRAKRPHAVSEDRKR
ncbi:MAG: hypothetical protein L0I29_01455 [Hyphomicrobiales bacterium]|nr:hypothetical protein [Hyphomicrobiales bacterium]